MPGTMVRGTKTKITVLKSLLSRNSDCTEGESHKKPSQTKTNRNKKIPKLKLCSYALKTKQDKNKKTKQNTLYLLVDWSVKVVCKPGACTPFPETERLNDTNVEKMVLIVHIGIFSDLGQ